MSKKIDERIPQQVGDKTLPLHAAVKSPWDKLVSYHDAAHYCQRYTAVVSAAAMQAFRILIPDYVERSKAICKNAYNRLDAVMGMYNGGVAAGALTNGPVRSLPPEKQQEMGRELQVAKIDETPTADSVAIVIYGLCTHMADGITGECVVADSGMMHNIVSHQPAIQEYPPKE